MQFTCYYMAGCCLFMALFHIDAAVRSRRGESIGKEDHRAAVRASFCWPVSLVLLVGIMLMRLMRRIGE